jgi:outer membrane protein OmpA-like peptidoglycan-associated protein
MAFLSPVHPSNVPLFAQVLSIVPLSAPSPDKIISGFPEYQDRLTREQHRELDHIAHQIVDSQSSPNPISAIVITGHADRDLRANNPKHKPGETRQQFEMRISEERAIAAKGLLKSKIKQLARSRGSTSLLDELLFDPRRIKTVPMGASDLLIQNPASETERSLNRRVEIFLVRTVQPGPPAEVDTFEKRIRRALGLLKTKTFRIDTTGKRKIRAVCLLNKMLRLAQGAVILELFADGTQRNRQIGTQTVPGFTADYPGNYDGSPRAHPRHPLLDSEFVKLCGVVSTLLKSRGWALSQPDDVILDFLDQIVMEKIYSGIVRVSRYITLQTNGVTGLYDGDMARIRLHILFDEHLDDENSVYNCWKDFTGGEDTAA